MVKSFVLAVAGLYLTACATALPEPEPTKTMELDELGNPDPNAPPITLTYRISFEDGTEDPSMNGLICKKIAYTGSRFPKEYCATRLQWETAQKEGRRLAGQRVR